MRIWPLLHGEACVAGGGGVFRDEDDAAGFAVEAIDDGDLAAGGELVAEEVAKAVPESAGAARFARVHEEAGRFVYGT